MFACVYRFAEVRVCLHPFCLYLGVISSYLVFFIVSDLFRVLYLIFTLPYVMFFNLSLFKSLHFAVVRITPVIFVLECFQAKSIVQHGRMVFMV